MNNTTTLKMVKDDESFTITFSRHLDIFEFYQKLDLLALSAGYQQESIDSVYICNGDELNIRNLKNVNHVD